VWAVSLKFGPLFLETLVKHYFARVVSDGSKAPVPLQREELLYDAAFNIVKDFLDGATRHTVEELQSFVNVRTPSPPWVHVVRLVIPTVSCDEAAVYLIKAFGGEDVMKRVVGGTKWWQVRGIRGLDAEWISTKKDWQDAKRRAKERQGSDTVPQEHTVERPAPLDPILNDIVLELPLNGEAGHPGLNSKETSRDSAEYQPEMDEMRCILYAHGGGYYFGSVDQERYSIQRFARKIHGRVFAVNYRLAPQYPFPCAIQDLLAAYIFLIRPPEGAAHRPIKPEHIIIAGDSAGGGLSLALLQVIRDSGLPAPAGGVLISPWCDLTHSFPSILTNTDTDVIPITGLSLHKPSPLWPPPSNDTSYRVRSGLRKSIADLHRRSESSDQAPPASNPVDLENVVAKSLPTTSGPMNVGSTTALPLSEAPDPSESIMLHTADGEVIEVAEQVQLYAPNALLKHPLVSPALSYLGGLPPLLFIAGDKEVLRDEIIYAAHRAAHPERFPARDEVKEMYPVLKNVEKHMRPTPVHLQVYDGISVLCSASRS
jgi:acetyl esterase/lipase